MQRIATPIHSWNTVLHYISILFRTMMIFLPQSRMVERYPFGLGERAVGGRHWICAVVSVTPSSTTQQGIDERALPGIELADDDDEEELFELADGCDERGAILGRGAEFGERGAQCRQRLTCLRKLSLGDRFKYARQHVSRRKTSTARAC